jgi:hypothetical protein
MPQTRRKLKKDNPFGALRPYKYYAGLTRKQAVQRRKEILKYGALDSKDPRAYAGFKTDAYGKRRRSSYTMKFKRLFPNARSIEERAAVTGVPKDLLQKSFDRGMAAWRTGHRPGATEQQWGYARVASLLLCGKTHYGPDADLVRAARTRSAKGRKWFARCPVAAATKTH